MSESNNSRGRPMLEAGMFLLMSEVSNQSIRPIIEWIIEENLATKKKKKLTLIISSPGGDLSAGFALIDTIKGSSIPINTIGIGTIASAALMIFMAGEKGNRILTPNTTILSHQYSSGSIGKEHELFGAIKEFELASSRIVEHYKKCTGLSDKKIRDELLPATDVYLTAQEAKKLGICDKIKEIY